MQTIEKIKVTEAHPDRARITQLIEAAAKRAGGFRQLAEAMDVHPQLVSNWKNGVKTPSAEAQAEIAIHAGFDPVFTSFVATMEKTSGKRYENFQFFYKKWMKERESFLEWKRTVGQKMGQITSL